MAKNKKYATRPGPTKWLEEARNGRPDEELDESPFRHAVSTGKSLLAFGVLGINDWLIGRFSGNLREVYPSSDWPWISEIEANFDGIRAELDAFLDRTSMPHVASMSGLDPDGERAASAVPPVEGAWRALLLYTRGEWVEETCAHFPFTRSLFANMGNRNNLGFSAVEGGSRIKAHVGPNRGNLRVQLPMIVPGQYGDCRIRVGSEMLNWEERKAIVFDQSIEHEVWNDTDDLRVLLMVEIEQPLRPGLRQFNRLAQYSYRWHPSYRKMPERVARISRELDARAASRKAS